MYYILTHLIDILTFHFHSYYNTLRGNSEPHEYDCVLLIAVQTVLSASPIRSKFMQLESVTIKIIFYIANEGNIYLIVLWFDLALTFPYDEIKNTFYSYVLCLVVFWLV